MEDARKVIVKLCEEARATGGKVENLERKIDLANAALQKMTEQEHVRNREVLGDERELSRYVGAGGTPIRLRTSKATIQFGGRQATAELPGLLDDTVDTCQYQRDLRAAVSRRALARLCQRNPETPTLDAEVLSIAARAPANIRDAMEKAISDTAGAGAEWIPDNFVPDLYEEFQVPRGLAALFAVVPMSSETIIRPKLTTGVRPYLKGRISSDDPSKYTASTPVTDDQNISSQGFAVRILVDDASAEDSAIALIPTMQRVAGNAIIDGYEDCMVNGDTTATHEDTISTWNIRSRWGSSGLGGSADHRRGFKGFRRIAVDRSNTADGSAAQTAVGVGTAIGTMGERAASDLVVVVSPEVFFKKLVLDPNVLTVDKLGAQATILTGQIASLFGHPVTLSRFISADLAATGLYTGTGSYSGLLTIDRGAFQHYERRGQIVEIDKQIVSGHIEIVITVRRRMETLSGATEKVVHWSYKWL